MEEDTTTPSQLQKGSRRGASEDDEAGDTGAARCSSRLAAGIDRGPVAEEKPETLSIQEEEEEEPDRTPHALREINFFYVCCAPDDDGAGKRTAGSTCTADLEPVDVELTLGGKGPFVASREDAVDTTLRLGLGPHSKAPDVAALGEDNDSLQLHLHGVPFSASPASTKLDPTLCRYPLPSPADPSTAGLDLNNPCPSKFPDDIIAADVGELPGETPEQQRRQSSTPYTFI